MDFEAQLLTCEEKVRGTQTKLHQWAQTHPDEAMHDVWGLVTHPTTLAEAWRRLAQHAGSNTPGIDGRTRRYVEKQRGLNAFLAEVRSDLRTGRFAPQPVRAVAIPKPDGGRRMLGIPTLKDRLVQMMLKLVLEPIFEADFQPSSYGYRPGRSPLDALAEIRHFGHPPCNYDHVVEADIKACFDRIDHARLMERVRRRVADRKVLRLIHAFLKAGVLDGGIRKPTTAGTPQGGVLSPLLANILLDGLDAAYAERYHDLPQWQRTKMRRQGKPVARLIRFADDFVVMVHGTRADAEAEKAWLDAFLREELRLELHPEKTRVTHLADGIEFLGYALRKTTSRRGGQAVVQYPRKKALAKAMDEVRALTRDATTGLDAERVLAALNAYLRGWTQYYRYGSSSATFGYLGWWVWHRVFRWLRRKHPKRTWRWVQHRYERDSNWVAGPVTLLRVQGVRTRRWEYRGFRIPAPWAPASGPSESLGPVGTGESRMR